MRPSCNPATTCTAKNSMPRWASNSPRILTRNVKLVRRSPARWSEVVSSRPALPCPASPDAARTMSSDRIREAEPSIGLLPLPEVPPALSAVAAEAEEALAAYLLDEDAAALPQLVRLMDECVAHPRFAEA